jgi:pilus assembly protein CpaE
MPPPAPLGPRLLRCELAQASVELVAVVPFVLLCAAVAWQLALAGQTAWLCANAARVAARAEAVGRDARGAARSALPAPLRRGLQVSRVGGGAIRVRIRMPFLLKSWPTPIVVSASAGLPRSAP